MSDEHTSHEKGAYRPSEIEPKWQQFWQDNKTFKTTEDPSKEKYYVLDMFPYPSGDGLHVGHPEGYTATDILSRYKRMKGFNVLHPMGWDSFGLPAEQHAIKTGTHPAATTEKNIANFKRQIQSIGLSYDWDREIKTSSPDYYRWTQWIFLKLYQRGLAYQSHEPVNWCPELGTVLANEEVIDGKSERGGYPVVRKPMRQWVLKITAYAERLLSDLEDLDWPESIKEMQRNWIGKSQGADVEFKLLGSEDAFTVFTTRPDTLFGATFCVLAPEHHLVEKVCTDEKLTEVKAYVDAATMKSDLDRTAQTKDKSGVFTGGFAINPVNGEQMPIWVADYVLGSYGHGAIMAVPGHDERDHEFASKFGIEIKRVLTGGEEEDITKAAHTGDGKLVNSGFLNGMDKKDAIAAMVKHLEDKELGRGTITYKLRDWLFSRQRYWGEPFPLAFDTNGNVVLFSEKDLPVTLPEVEDFKPSGDGSSPLAKAEEWLRIEDDDNRPLVRETNTMPQWAGSCWYYLRYCDPTNSLKPWDAKKENYWMPVDLYVGGAEHAVLHLLYARFWHKVLFDCGLVSTKEPFQRLVNQGMILGENNEKMSKSRGNVVNPDDVIRDWGADSLRLYEMFMGPLEASKPWQTKGISGVSRFLKRSWRVFVLEDGSISPKVQAKSETEATTKILHKTIKKVTADIESLSFNTAIAAMMELVNHLYKDDQGMTAESAKKFALILSPFAPHLGEEVWSRLGEKDTLAYQAWPEFDPALVTDDMMTISVQINGKTRGTIEVEKDATKESVLEAAKAEPKVKKYLEGQNLIREIYVPGRIVSLVVK